MLYQALEAHLKGDSLAPCYIIRGNDPYLKQSAYKKLTARVLNPLFNLNVFESCDSEEDLLDALGVMPLGEKYRMVAVNEFKEGVLQSIGRAIIKYLQNPEPFSVLVLTDTGNAVFNDIAKYAQTIVCDKLKDIDLRKYINSQLNNIEPIAVDKLILFCGGDMGRITNECQKLRLYRGGEKITASDVDLLVSRDADYKIYELTTALSVKDKNRAYEIWAELRKTDEAWMIHWLYKHFRRLLYTLITDKTDAELMSIYDVRNEWAIKHYRKQAANFGALKLKKILDYLENAEFSIKSGDANLEAATNNALLQILNI